MTSTSETPSPPAEALNTSRLRTVKRSIQTKLPQSILEMEQMLARPAWWVCSRYTVRAPAEHIPRG